MTSNRLTGIDRSKIREMIAERFNMDEIRTLCSDLNIDHEDIPGDTKRSKIDEILRYCERHRIVGGLLRRLQEVRPDEEWRASFTDAGLLTRNSSGDIANDFIIIDVASIIDYSMEDIERVFGQYKIRVLRGINSAEELPMGGETREYSIGKFVVAINYDRTGKAQGVQIVEGLSECGCSLEHWSVVLSRFGMTVFGAPEISAPAARNWNNFTGCPSV